MNLERIAEIEAAFGEETLMAVIDFADVAELCRLARLGLRVEGAPTCSLRDVENTVDGLRQFADVIARLDGMPVALVVVEESK